MTKYAKNLRAQYANKSITKSQFIYSVLSEADKRDREENIVIRATQALVYLGKQGQWVKGQHIFNKCNFKKYKNTTNHGLWPWNENNAEVIEKRGKGSGREYKIKEEFYDVLKQQITHFFIGSSYVGGV